MTTQEKKKFVIKPLRSRPRVPENFQSDNWNRLENAVKAIHTSQSTSYSLEELYRAVSDLCLHGLSRDLYEKLYMLCDAHAALMISGLSQERASMESIGFLKYVLEAWQTYCSQLLLIRQVFLMLDRTYILSDTEYRSLFDLGLRLLEKHLSLYPEVEGKIVEGVLGLIDGTRGGEAIDAGMVQEAVRMLVDLGLYEKEFENKFIHRSVQWYIEEGERLVHVRIDLFCLYFCFVFWNIMLIAGS